MSCLDERYTMSGGKCTYCPEGASVGKTIGALSFVMAVLFLIFACLFMRAKEEKDEFLGRAEAYRSGSQKVIDRVKIVYGWLQIFTALTFTFDIAW